MKFKLTAPYEEVCEFDLVELKEAIRQIVEEAEWEYDDYVRWTEDPLPFPVYVDGRALNYWQEAGKLEVGESVAIADWYECERTE